MRLKHVSQGSGLMLYDKHGQVLRVETSSTNPEAFRVDRTPGARPKGKKRWMTLRDRARRVRFSERERRA